MREIDNRQAHAAALSENLHDAVEASALAREQWEEELRATGIVLAVEGWPGGFELAIESLDLRGSGIELLSVQESVGELPTAEVATVYVPDDKVDQFFGRLERYATEDTPAGKPRHEKLVANIAALQRATLAQLWTDSRPFPEDEGERRWWEVWLRRTGDERTVLISVAEQFRWEVAARFVEFPGRIVTAVNADASSLGAALSTSLPLAEVRHASLIQSPAELHPATQREWAADLLERLQPAPEGAPTVCILDTGVFAHTLLTGPLGHRSTHYAVGLDGLDRGGHGTAMSGLAMFGDLSEPLTSGQVVQLEHRLESVKILPDPGATPSPPETYGAVTAAGVATPETSDPSRRRTFCMANSFLESDGRPTLWSATIDALSFGTDVVRVDGGLELLSEPDPESSRLLMVAGGNVLDPYRHEFLELCDISPIEDPGQAWNALTVGAFTELEETPGQPEFAGYRPLAPFGELSPFSRTSVGFSSIWPIKPDIVMEGGNLLVSPEASHFDQHDVVSLTTTSYLEPIGRPFTTLNATSAAAAQASRLSAIAAAHYPALWPETRRGLIVHSAEWTEPMLTAINGARTKTERQALVRRYGFGTPTLDRVLRSASSAVTLMAQSRIQPFDQVDKSRTRLREMHLHDLPWPREQLLDLGDTPVRLRVTLSYFIEPNPSSRGWRGRYVYPSHGLRFDIRRPGETTAEFRRRLNRLAETEEGGTQRGGGPEPNWMVGPVNRNLGSLHGDLWLGTAAELADSGLIGVYPIGGWWKNNNRQERNELEVRYALLVSLVTPEVEVDLYSPIALQIGIPIEIET